MRNFSRVLVALLLGLASLMGSHAVAAATVPDWSGLDARFYDGPIPAPGALIESVPLNPALSVAGAASAYRILYSSTDQHQRPAVGTAAVFTPRTPAPEGLARGGVGARHGRPR